MYGPERLRTDLAEMGHTVEMMTGEGALFAVIIGYEIPIGRFLGRIVDLGIPATADFPRTPGSSIHIRTVPQLFDYSDTLPGKRNIIKSPLGPEWRYWSHNFGWQGEKSARRLMNQIKGIFENA